MKKEFDSEQDNCPECGSLWNDGDVLEKLRKTYPLMSENTLLEWAGDYGWTPKNKAHFGRVIGIEIQGEYDGVSYYQCPDCQTTWDRFTGEKQAKGFAICKTK
jgi:Zn-finger nucleic acid-binding protein